MDLIFENAQLRKVIAAANEDAQREGKPHATELTLANNREGVFLQSSDHRLFVDDKYVEPVVCHAIGFNPYAPGVDRFEVNDYRRSVMGGDDFFATIPLDDALTKDIEQGKSLNLRV